VEAVTVEVTVEVEVGVGVAVKQPQFWAPGIWLA
jgi:hypothetical protein